MLSHLRGGCRSNRPAVDANANIWNWRADSRDAVYQPDSEHNMKRVEPEAVPNMSSLYRHHYNVMNTKNLFEFQS